MDTIRAIVRDGRIETDVPLELPDGTELLIAVPVPGADDEHDWDNSPEGIAAWLAWADSLEPLVFTEEERAAWAADQQSRKEWEKSHFDDYAAKLREAWK
jgi:hypothetical protein